MRIRTTLAALLETIGGKENAGSLTIVPAGKKGLSPGTSYGYQQDTAGAPGENAGDGAGWFLKGTSTRLRTKGVVSFGAGSIGLGAHPQPELGTPITG
ncbi:hypothetical protein OG381_25195 [Streptomyces sp. NBC_00490]|uniref:hypothetical protein n=1 Tax=Streptomyces sp. NBC_00490 TaxID=2903657 RepID=UPI002E183510